MSNDQRDDPPTVTDPTVLRRIIDILDRVEDRLESERAKREVAA